MAQILFYDIEADNLRSKIADKILRIGFERIQYSVFVGLLDRKRLTLLMEELNRLIDTQKYPNDKLYVIEVPVERIQKMKMLGKPLDTDYLTGNKDVLFF